MIPFFKHAAWYLESIEFLSMPTDSLGEFSFVRPRLIFPAARSHPSVFAGLVFLFLFGLLVGLILLCR